MNRKLQGVGANTPGLRDKIVALLQSLNSGNKSTIWAESSSVSKDE